MLSLDCFAQSAGYYKIIMETTKRISDYVDALVRIYWFLANFLKRICNCSNRMKKWN